MKRNRVALIRKRDGSVERFSCAKLQRCLSIVLDGTRQDVRLAGPLARAVAIHLADWSDKDLPTSEYVYRCVQAVFTQTDLGVCARRLAAHRRQRRALRKQTRVVYPHEPQTPPVGWRKTRVVRALRRSHGLRTPVARLVAAEVEAHVLGLGFQFVQSAVIAALVQNVLMTWGLSADGPRRISGVAVSEPAAEPRAANRQDEQN